MEITVALNDVNQRAITQLRQSDINITEFINYAINKYYSDYLTSISSGAIVA